MTNQWRKVTDDTPRGLYVVVAHSRGITTVGVRDLFTGEWRDSLYHNAPIKPTHWRRIPALPDALIPGRTRRQRPGGKPSEAT